MASWGGSSVCSNQGIGSKGCYPWCLLKEAIRTLKINSKHDLTFPGHLNIQTDTYWHLDYMIRVEKNKTKPTNWKAYLCKTALLLNHSCASWRKYRTFYVYCFHVKALVFVSLKLCLCTALLTYLKAGRAVWLLSLTILKIMMCNSRLVTAVEGIIPDPASDFSSSPFPLSKTVTFLLHLEDKCKPNEVTLKMYQQQCYRKL